MAFCKAFFVYAVLMSVMGGAMFMAGEARLSPLALMAGIFCINIGWTAILGMIVGFVFGAEWKSKNNDPQQS